MSKHNDELFKKAFEEGFKKQHSRGLAQGAVAVCSVLYDIARDTTKTPDERIDKIIAFCSVALNAKEKEELVSQKEGDKHEV